MQILADSAGFGSEIELFRPFEALPVSFHTERDNCSYYALCGDNQHTSFCRGYMEYRLSNALRTNLVGKRVPGSILTADE